MDGVWAGQSVQTHFLKTRFWQYTAINRYSNMI